MRNVIFVIAAAALVASAATAQSPAPVEQAYTPLDLNRCRHQKGQGPEDYGAWQCAGYGGIAVLVSGADQRVTVSFGPNAANEPAASQSLPAFNSEGKTIEWRIERGEGGVRRAFATILRWNTSVTQDSGADYKGQVLVVTRLGPGGVCHVGYVDGRANRNANELSQQIADKHARGFNCKTDKPIVLGIKGPGFSANLDGPQ